MGDPFTFTGFGGLAIKPFPALIVVTLGEIGRFHKGLGQILVAAFAVVVAFLLAVAQAFGIHCVRQ